MSEVLRPVKRVLVVDGDRKFLAKAVVWMTAHERHVEIARDVKAGLDRWSSEQFDLVISDLFFDGEPGGLDLMNTVLSFGQTTQRLAIATSGLTVKSALCVARLLPDDVMLREKGKGVFDSILHEAETGETPDDVWDDGFISFEASKTKHVYLALTRTDFNRSEAARRLGVSRATLKRYIKPSPAY